MSVSTPIAPTPEVGEYGSLVPAETCDFVNGSELFVRGRPAVCTRFDAPHVYWTFTDVEQPIEKHRSFSCTPEIFAVRAENKRRHDDNLQASLTDTSDEEDEPRLRHHHEQPHHQQADEPSPTSDDEPVEAPAAPAAAAEDAAARASLMGMFARRPEKAFFSNVVDTEVEPIQAAAPQSVSIENSTRSSFRVANKVTSITLLNCEEVELDFLSVISSVELIRCRRCTIRCAQVAATYALDDTDAVSILFPGFQSRVMVVSTNSTATTLTARPGGNPPPTGDGEVEEKTPVLDSEVVYEVVAPEPAAALEAEEVAVITPAAGEPTGGDSAASSSAAPVQYRTTWSNGAFATEILTRKGITGYFANNA